MTEPTAASPQAAPSPLLMRAALGTAAALVLIAGGTFYLATRIAHSGATGADAVAVSVTATGCEPSTLSTTAGRTTFAIRNASDRALEWEILDGVMVVAERENIAPGLTATVTPTLAPGTYSVTCGLLSNPRGTLTVAPGATATAPAAPDLTAFIGPLAEMQVYQRQATAAFTTAVADLRQAIAGGDIEAARAAYARATAAYARIEPAARRFADLGSAIAGTATYLEGREADPTFTGLHRIEYGLFTKAGVDGLGAVADRLASDTETLSARIAARKPDPDALAGDAADWLGAQSQSLAAGGRELYAGNDLGDLASGLESVRKSIDLATPPAARVAAAQVAAAEAAYAALQKHLASLRGDGGYPDFRQLPADQRTSLADEIGALGDALAALSQRIESGKAAL